MRFLYAYDNSLPLQSGYVFYTLAILSHHRDTDWETNHLTMPKQNTEFNSYQTIYSKTGNPIITDHGSSFTEMVLNVLSDEKRWPERFTHG